MGFEARAVEIQTSASSGKPKEIADKPAKTPEKQVEELAIKKLGEYEGKVRDAKSEEGAEAKVKEVVNALNATFKGNPKLINQLPKDYEKEYDNIFSWGGTSWSVKLEKINGELKATSTRSLPDWGKGGTPPP